MLGTLNRYQGRLGHIKLTTFQPSAHVFLLIPRLIDRQPMALTLALLVDLRDFAEFVSMSLNPSTFIALQIESLGSVPIYKDKQVRASAPEE